MAIKVLNITEEGRGGGPLKRIKDVAQKLMDQDIETTVLFPNKESDVFKASLEEASIPVIEMSMHRLTKTKGLLLVFLVTFIPEVIRLIQLIRKNKYDIILCNGSWQIKGVLAAKFSNAKSIWIQNDSYQPKIVARLFKFASKRADAFVFVSERTKEFYSSINPQILNKPNVIIQSPVDIERFSPDLRKENTKTLSEDGIKILSVGYINNNKGFDTLIRAIHEINNNTTEKIHFYIAGPVFDNQQDYYDMLKHLQKELGVDNLTFLGMRKDIDILLNEVDIYVCSSDFEASPISVWEALSSALPVVSTNVGDVEKIFTENDCGIVVASKKPKQLSLAVLKLLQDNNLRTRYSKKARETALNLFSLEAVSKEYKKFYELIANQ